MDGERGRGYPGGKGPPDRRAALAQYQEHAFAYDAQTDFAAADRRRVVELLSLRPGDVVLDVGCGTGLCFPLIVEAVGPAGRVVGIEQSVDMLVRAQERIDEWGWENVELVLGSAEDVALEKLGGPVDAALFCFTHDVLRTPAALENVLSALRPGARVAAVGPMWAPWWAPGMNVLIWYVTSQYVTTFEGFSRPWSHLERLVPGLSVDARDLSGRFFAWGTTPSTTSF